MLHVSVRPFRLTLPLGLLTTPSPNHTYTTSRTTTTRATTLSLSWFRRSSSKHQPQRQARRGSQGQSRREVKSSSPMPTPLPRLSLHLAFLLSGTFTHAFRVGARTQATAGLSFPHRALSSTSTCSNKALVSTLVFSTSGTPSSSSSLPPSLSRSPSSSSSLPSSLSRSSWDSRNRSIKSNAQSNRSMSFSSSSSPPSSSASPSTPPPTSSTATTIGNNDKAGTASSSDSPKRKRGRPSSKANAIPRAAAAGAVSTTSLKQEGREKGEALLPPVQEKKAATARAKKEEATAAMTTSRKRGTKKETPPAPAAPAPPAVTEKYTDPPFPPPPVKQVCKKVEPIGEAAVPTATSVATTTTTAAASATAAAAAPLTKVLRTRPPRTTISRAFTPRIEDGSSSSSLLSSSSSSSSTSQQKRLFRLLSWNVAGLRGLLKKGDTTIDAFRSLLLYEKPDILCLQETKLQEDHVAEVSAALRALHLPGYQGNWHCSTAKKGYSGTSILISEEAGLSLGPGRVKCGMKGEKEGEGEGRVITIDFGAFCLVNVYTPNSGEGLKRLEFRTERWDRAFEQHLLGLQRGGEGERVGGGRDGGRAVLCCGDLNVAFEDADFFNPGEPRMAKAAGTTPEERASFGRLLEGAGMVDTFRFYHPEATGCYSYWSMRAGNRPFNRGMRLDYFLASQNMMEGKGEGKEGVPRVLDSFILDQATVGLSDHAPVGVLLEIEGRGGAPDWRGEMEN